MTDGRGNTTVIAYNIPPFHSSTNYYTWGNDLSGSLQGAGGVGGLLAVTTVSSETSSLSPLTYYPLFDANGNVTEYVTTNGTVADRYAYDAFGDTVASTGPLAGAFTHRFSTKQFDAETGLVMYQLRPYEPGLGRWLSKDPIEERGGLNLYEFVGNGPLNQWDVVGLKGSNDGPWWNNFINIVARMARYKKPWYKYSGIPWTLSASPYEYVNLSPPETLQRKSGCNHLQAIEYTIEPAGGVGAFNTIGDPDNPYRLWDGGQVRTDWGYRNVFRFFPEVIFSGSGINRSVKLLWELSSNFEKWTWGTTASKTVVEPISAGSVSLTVTVRLHLLVDGRDGMQGVNNDTDIYTVAEDKYEIQD